ncbi:glycosyl transferase family protein [Stakelama sp. CBK3Z-3]|uniref:Glycosyl transferase family protein n=1 Tax=Stakelama flava TaxID=2860338 RepID=A0ABS6XKB0_9SPHN|nr:glycosyl transferase family protein [Stakelama flava]MBW4330644.1 glycosyl transferase family protein [Stakelama flava]
MDGASIIAAVDAVARETTLFASVGFILGGLDDLAVDAIYLTRCRAILRSESHRIASLGELAPAPTPPLAIFIAAWDEANVIGQMLRHALERIDYPDYQIHVGTYPNDRATIAAVAQVAECDSRVRLVVGPTEGPTTKADCLNAVWRAMLRDEANGRPLPTAVIVHDAEDVVHRDELRVQAALIRDHDLVQLPVVPLMDSGSRLVAGHYGDEFAEAHGKMLPVRHAIGAALPLAGVGCGVRTEMLRRLADERGDGPFDGSSLTEDYEMGLTISRLGGRAVFARITEYPGGPAIAVRAFFPARLDSAVRQKARWMVGIALAGWDRIGWGGRGEIADHWMRMRDRRALVAVLVLMAGYIGVVSTGIAILAHYATGIAAPPVSDALHWLLTGTFALLSWRLAMRAWFTGRLYGWREAAWSLPRAMVGNFVSLLAARRAVTRYIAMLFGSPPVWDKTDHRFPDIEAESARQ